MPEIGEGGWVDTVNNARMCDRKYSDLCIVVCYGFHVEYKLLYAKKDVNMVVLLCGTHDFTLECM